MQPNSNDFRIFLFSLLIFVGLSPLMMAQSGMPGRLQFDFRHSESLSFEHKFQHTGIGIEYIYIDRERWQLGARFGASFKYRTDFPEDFISHWLGFDISSYQRIGENWRWLGGIGFSTGLQPEIVTHNRSAYYDLVRASWPYVVLGVKRDFADHRFFIQLQSRAIPYPDIEVLRSSQVDLAIGVRLGRTTQP
ncbi:MAG: hypothetical protein AB8H47_21700 [Bacteroidia bacterium]